MVVEITEWYFEYYFGEETLVGRVKGHPKRPDGNKVRTSTVMRREGDLVWTRTGTCYQLTGPESNDSHVPSVIVTLVS